MNVRVQVNDGTATDTTKKGLERIGKLCDVISEKFNKERERFHNSAMKDVDQ
jgi:DNA-directed RNA polymerase subunit L